MERNIQKRQNIFNVLELPIWIMISILLLIRLIVVAKIEAFSINRYADETDVFNLIFKDFYFSALIVIIVFLFPILFKFIYGELPFQHLKSIRLKRIDNSKTTKLPQLNETIKETENIKDIFDNADTNKKDIVEHTVNELGIIEIYLKQSQKLSEQIFSRSSAYLLIGCLIAFAGVIFFYFQSFYAKDVADFTGLSFTLRETLPRIGVLIFVEAIAFFFLKQYKSTMEEFRYYEAIKRQRENQYLIANYVVSNKDNINDFTTIIDKLNLNENPNKLSKEETTQLLENQKISAQDNNFIEKMIDMLKIIRKE